MPSDQKPPDGGNAPNDLSHAGAIVDKAIEYMISQNIGGTSIASALLGGAMGVLVRGMDDEGVVRILERAIAGVRSGDLRRLNT